MNVITEHVERAASTLTNNAIPAAAVAFSFLSFVEQYRDVVSLIVMCLGGLASLSVFLRNVQEMQSNRKKRK